MNVVVNSSSQLGGQVTRWLPWLLFYILLLQSLFQTLQTQHRLNHVPAAVYTQTTEVVDQLPAETGVKSSGFHPFTSMLIGIPFS